MEKTEDFNSRLCLADNVTQTGQVLKAFINRHLLTHTRRSKYGHPEERGI